MRTIFESLRTIFVSLEFIVIFAAIILFFYLPHIIEPISKHLEGGPENAIKFIAVIPVGLFIWVVREARGLLFPLEVSKKALQKWKDYWKWKIVFYVAIGYSLLFAVVGIIPWATGIKFSTPEGFIIIMTSVIGGFIVASSVYFANIKLKEILAN